MRKKNTDKHWLYLDKQYGELACLKYLKLNNGYIIYRQYKHGGKVTMIENSLIRWSNRFEH